MKVKIFTDDGNASKLEIEINKWLSEHPNIKIHFIKQGYSAGEEQTMYTLISIWYEDSIVSR